MERRCFSGTGTLLARNGVVSYGTVTNDSVLRITGGLSELTGLHSTPRSAIHLEESTLSIWDEVSAGQFVLTSNAHLGFPSTNHVQDGTAFLGNGRVTPEQRAFRMWLEPFKEWLKTAQTLGEIVEIGSPVEKKRVAGQVFGSNLFLDSEKPVVPASNRGH